MNLAIKNTYLEHSYPILYLALNHHKTHKNQPISFIKYPYLIDVYKDTSPKMVLKKSTQSGITEWLIVRTFQRSKYLKRNIFYVLPTEKLKNQFINSRFDKSVTNTTLYREVFRNSTYDNMSIKQVEDASIFFAVSNSRNNFTSFPADDFIVDEMNECNLDNLTMAPERLAFCSNPTEVYVSNPTYPDLAIDYEFDNSDQKHWYISCENCHNKFSPDFFKHVVQQIDENEYIIRDSSFESFYDTRDIQLICDKCGSPVDRHSHGEWVPHANVPDVSGRQLNQLFTSNKKVKTIVKNFNEALTNEVKLQRFYNGTLGLSYLGKGARIDDELINTCISNYAFPYKCKESCVIGMDVGKTIHTTIFHVMKNEYSNILLRLVYAGELHFPIQDDQIDISELMDLFRRFKIVSGIIDAKPEDRLARMISTTFIEIFRCIYLTDNPKDSIDLNRKIFETDRTMAMDGVKEALILKNILFPNNIDSVPKFRDQLKAPMRVYEEKEASNGRMVWREGNKADHYFHSIVYAQQAVRLLTMVRG